MFFYIFGTRDFPKTPPTTQVSKAWFVQLPNTRLRLRGLQDGCLLQLGPGLLIIILTLFCDQIPNRMMMIFTAKTYYSTLILLLEFSCPSVSSSLRLPIRSFVPIFDICVRCISVKCMGVWVTWAEHPKGTKIANQLILQQNS